MAFPKTQYEDHREQTLIQIQIIKGKAGTQDCEPLESTPMTGRYNKPE
jgi:hypothetical protein